MNIKKNQSLTKKIFSTNQKFKKLSENLFSFLNEDISLNQTQTENAFSKKWNMIDYNGSDFKQLENHSKNWYLDLYGFKNENDFKIFLKNSEIILDAGCGPGHKAAWMAELNPEALVIAVDISDSIFSASKHYKHLKNIIWIKGNLGDMPYFDNNFFNYVSCDQVIMHTTNPFLTFKELNRITSRGGQLSVYVYRKKAVPRELLDEYFRHETKKINHKDLSDLSLQLTELGKMLSSLDIELDFPDIPLLDIKGGKMDLQRFIYWNFIKCFWDDEMGQKNSYLINYDWYAPSQAQRYTEEEFKKWISDQKLEHVYFHKENACFSGRFQK
mgnify:CR=1 FL=1